MPSLRAVSMACLAASIGCTGDDDGATPTSVAASSGSASSGSASSGSGGAGGGDPLEHLAPTGELPLSPGNADGQDEDPTLLRAQDGTLCAAWYSNRNGPQPDGAEDREIFLSRSSDGVTWTDPPIQLTRHARYAFFPSLAQDAAGVFHLAWWRVVPTPEGCVPDVDCDGGTTNRILYKSSPDGLAWDLDEEIAIAEGPGDWLPSIVADRETGRLLVYFVSVTRDETGEVALPDGAQRIYVAENDGSGWGAPRRLTGINPDTSQETFPHVLQAADGSFVMTWTRYDAAAPNDVLQVISEPSTVTMTSTSEDGLSWSEPAAVSDEDPAAGIDALPSLYVEQDGTTWNALWRSVPADGSKDATVELALGAAYPDDLVERPEITGYSGRVVATATPGIYWGAWVAGPTGKQKIRYAFFSK